LQPEKFNFGSTPTRPLKREEQTVFGPFRLDALTRLCRQPGGASLVALLRQHAPMWLAQMPGLVSAEERERLRQETTGATRERMLREMSQAVELLTADAPLLLVVEDLHWSDYSTIDLLSSLATGRRPARLMLVGTYRPAEVLAAGHPLKGVKQELHARRRCEELPLSFLDERAVCDYLSHRLRGTRVSAGLARWTHRRTDGNPLFMVNVIDYLLDRGLIARDGDEWRLAEKVEREGQGGVPENIRQMIERQIDRLGRDEQRMLEAASVAGAEFTVAAVASALGEDVLGVGERCEELARRHQLLRAARFSELPGGMLTARYGFIHALYQNALYERIAPARRARLHQRIGEHVEGIYGERAAEFAAELAMHFEQARDQRRAVRYLQLAAENGSRRFAHREAVALARRGLELLKSQPDAPERAYQELTLRATLCVPLAATEGYGAAEVEETYSRARSAVNSATTCSYSQSSSGCRSSTSSAPSLRRRGVWASNCCGSPSARKMRCCSSKHTGRSASASSTSASSNRPRAISNRRSRITGRKTSAHTSRATGTTRTPSAAPSSHGPCGRSANRSARPARRVRRSPPPKS
jgi:predicted ATPase